MKQYGKNPRKITKKQLEQLKANIEELGDLSGIVHDLNSDEIISGNQRSKVFRPSLDLIFGKEKAQEICDQYDNGMKDDIDTEISEATYKKLIYLDSLKH